MATRLVMTITLAALGCGGANPEPASPQPAPSQSVPSQPGSSQAAAATSGAPNCGEHACDPATTYCYQTGGGAEVAPDAPSPPITSRCESFAKTCAVDPPDCSCLAPWVNRLVRCSRDDTGLFRVWEDAP